MILDDETWRNSAADEDEGGGARQRWWRQVSTGLLEVKGGGAVLAKAWPLIQIISPPINKYSRSHFQLHVVTQQ